MKRREVLFFVALLVVGILAYLVTHRWESIIGTAGKP
jgi:hypothetical protein